MRRIHLFEIEDFAWFPSSLRDLDELLVGLDGSDYRWEKGTIDAKPSKKLYLLGVPAST
jgi:hypothetical protein